MRKITPFIRTLLMGAGILLVLPGCFKDKITQSYTIITPVYTLKTTVLANLNGSPSQPIDSIGRIYIKDQFIYLNEPDKGIHIIDNSNPAQPVQVAFLNVPGNREMAVKGNTLYADMYRDLLAIDISDPHHINVTGTSHDIFMDRYDGIGGYTSVNNGMITDSNVMLTSYIRKDTVLKTTAPKSLYPGGIYYYAPSPGYNALSSSSSGGSNSGNGLAGSMAKLVLLNNYMYTLSEPHSLAILNVTNAPKPVFMSTFMAGFDLETIYPFNDKLFLGSQEGVYIYDVSNPGNPTKLSTFTHGRACDPVVADGNYAYVTLHSGTYCGGASNELDVLNVQDLLNPTLAASYPMTSPQGLCKDNNLLFVCDGSAGIKLYDATNPAALKLLSHIDITSAADLIASNQRLLVIANGKLYQYDYSNTQNIRLISTFSAK
ncbi:MAG TPA: hypothetical protein VL832_20010 [Puia sp.]|nr:hypothetical protein [Puia sp.]